MMLYLVPSGKDEYQENVSLAINYLEGKVSGGVLSNYSLSLVAYTLALANSPLSFTALLELSRRADYIGDSASFLLRF